MKLAHSDLGGVESDIPSLDPARIAAKVKALVSTFQDHGADLNEPCGNTANLTKCWIAWHLPNLNKVLCTASMQVIEHAPGAFTLSSFSDEYVDCESSEATYLDSAILAYWLLKCHHCIKRLDLADSAILFSFFPILLCKALRANKGLEDIRIDPDNACGAWSGMQGPSALASTLARLSVGLKSLNIQQIMTANVTLQGIESTIRRGTMRHLTIWNGMSRRTASKMFHAVGNSSCLSELQIGGTEMFTPSNAVLLAEALKRNKTLQKLSLDWMRADVVGIILASLKHNSTLEELSLFHSHDELHSTLWDGLQALCINTRLKCLKIINASLRNSCAMVIADVLQRNSTLQELGLSMNTLGDLGARALAKALRQNSSLKRLDISECRLTEGAVSSFVESLALNNTIERVCLGNMEVSEEWAPTLPLTANVCARLEVTWNTRGLEQWAACMSQDDQSCSHLSVAWTAETNPDGVVKWFSAARVSCTSLTELVICCPGTVPAECAKAFVYLLEATNSLKKLTVETVDHSYNVVTETIRGLACNKTVREAEFHQYLHTDQDVKALHQLLSTNRTLHRLKFRSYNLSKKALVSLAHALEDNFVFLSLDFEYSPALKTYPVLCALNRNQSLLNRAVECVLNSSVDDESMQALRLLSTTDSLLDAVAAVSGKPYEECRCLVQDAERRL
ncbi:uncharacterized protein LOC144107774 [Amblyomma americanum]